MTAKPTIPRPKVLYVLGAPFSGSTLFAAALGTSRGYLNLGEVNFIENDWYDEKKCSCGHTIVDCVIWGKVKRTLGADANTWDFSFSDGTRSRKLDGRSASAHQKAFYFVGLPLDFTFGRKVVQDYACFYERFYEALYNAFDQNVLVDCSKSSPRLEALNTHDAADLFVVYLKRRPEMVFASRIKRAKRRNRAYISAMSFFYGFWLLYHLRFARRCLSHLDERNVIEVDYEEFCQDPLAVTKRLGKWLGRPIDIAVLEPDLLDLSGSHVFTGNAWLTKGKSEVVKLRRPEDNTGLTGIEKQAERFAVGLCRIFGVRW
ncbi:MAG: hypothetical protein AAFY84_15990 [Pseudomonadota bacterium]